MSASGPVRKAKKTRADWRTPQAFFDELDREFHFTIDGAASKENFLVKRYYSLGGEDAFLAEPVGERIFVNCPYGNLGDWVELYEKWAQATWAGRAVILEDGRWMMPTNTVVALLPNNTDTAWFGKLFATCTEIRFVYPRLAFVHPGTEKAAKAPAGGNMVVIWRGIRPASISAPKVGLIGANGEPL